MGKSNIEWTDVTWNPIVGCSLVSPGCTNCYAQTMAHRIQKMHAGQHAKALAGSTDHGPIPTTHYDGTTKVVNGNPVWTGKLALAPEHILRAPLSWTRPRKIFVNSMSDVFHEGADQWWVASTLATAIVAHHYRGHVFQFLTKRSKIMRTLLNNDEFWLEVGMFVDELVSEYSDSLNRSSTDLRATVDYDPDNPPAGLWFGVSTEDQQRANERVYDLLHTPAAVRFASYEPALGPVLFDHIRYKDRYEIDALRGMDYDQNLPCSRLDWVICGGESGPRFRPMQMQWAESVMEQCKRTGTAFFFKQDSAAKPGQQGIASDELWACKAFPKANT